MKQYFTISIINVAFCFASFIANAQQSQSKQSSPQPQLVKLAPVREIIPSKTIVEKSVQSPAPQILPQGNIISVTTIKTEPQPINEIQHGKPIDGLKLSPAPVNMDRPKGSTITKPVEK